MYAVIDVETTGLRTSWHDRVIEMSVVQLDSSGRVQDEWCSLVNPDRDLGPQHIHGISAAEVRRAPSFDQLASQVTDLLKGRVMVAHNLAFDAMFVASEFRHLGVNVPVGSDLGLCTMRLAPHFLPSAGRSLVDCRRAAGLPDHRAHSALHDARAAAELFSHYLQLTGTPPPWGSVVDQAATLRWPALYFGAAVPVQRRSPEEREPHFLTRLVDRLPRQHEPRADAYLDLLDQALLDRHISAIEADGLVAAADAIGLYRADVQILHQRYLAGLASAALADRVVTPAEHKDLDSVAALLGLPATAVNRALEAARPSERPVWQLASDDLVVFTGTMDPLREQWEARASAAGLRVGDNVTKKTRLLVAADPDSMSGKAKKARQYGIPIVHPAAFRSMQETLLPA
ncbi:exonuclease domain-containing protein [Actinoplanes friuliensis]|uniref:DNA polymerase III subunit epsilon n=1 Tax=Actinoplanes friuliensis DSM 7358 TaxID=1246995 RepID=U5VTV1_9ACTN|nr:exonuclease domain-containing protein [Actinoplanes friuliensis]AGZ40237.1 DNA polymerase III subunit epsilon [Actinoplanes friuliensis DSM 7358]